MACSQKLSSMEMSSTPRVASASTSTTSLRFRRTQLASSDSCTWMYSPPCSSSTMGTGWNSAFSFCGSMTLDGRLPKVDLRS